MTLARRTTIASSGFTLLELLVVVAILAVLAGVILPQLGSSTDRARDGTAASTLGDVARMIETYKALHGSYADGWDTLASSTSSPASLHKKLTPQLLSGSFFNAPAVQSADVYASLKLTGVNHVQANDDASTGFPGDSGTLSGHLVDHSGAAANVPLVTIQADGAGNPSSSGYRLLKEEFNVPSHFTGGTDTSYLGTHVFVALGFGPKNWMVSEVVQTPPVIDVEDPGRYYSRAIAIFAFPKTGIEKGDFIGVIGPDGRGVKSALSSYYKQAPRDH